MGGQAKDRDLNLSNSELERSQARLQALSREETSMRRQAAELAAVNIEVRA